MALTPTTIQAIACPNCQHTQAFTMYPYLHVNERPHLYDMLLDGSLFLCTCEQCEHTQTITYPMLIDNSDYRYLIFFTPHYHGDGSEYTITDLIPNADPAHYRDYQWRLVKNLPELIEKVVIFETGLNDAVVETVKILSHALFQEQFPEEKVLGMYFYQQPSEAPYLLAVGQERQGKLPYNEQLMAAAYKKRSQSYFHCEPGRFHQIDRHWAIHALGV